MAGEAGHLEIAGILTDVRIIERTIGMGLFERAVVEHVVEDHGNGERADLHAFRRLVL